MVSEKSCGSDGKKAKYEAKVECPKCEGAGCDHCDDTGYHEKEKPPVEEKKTDPVDDKEAKGKFKDREDKDIDNDGDVDSSDEYLHKRRKAIASKGKKPAGNSGEKTPEISKIGEAFDDLWAAIEEARKETAGATPPEGMDDKESESGKKFKAMHKVDAKDHDDMEKVEEPKERKVKKEDVSEFEVIRRLLSGQIDKD